MILLTKLNGRAFVLNAELIRIIEATPDTLISLTDGDSIRVLESVDEVVEKAVDYKRRVHGFTVV